MNRKLKKLKISKVVVFFCGLDLAIFVGDEAVGEGCHSGFDDGGEGADEVKLVL